MTKPTPLFKTLLASTFMVVALAACSHDYGHKPTSETPQERNDADMQQVLDAQASLGLKPIETLSAQQARLQPTPADGVMKVLRAKGKNPMPKMGVNTRMISIAGAVGSIPATVYTPENADKSLPVVVYFHGGGWVIANPKVYDSSARAIAKFANAIVVSVDYRKAPEHKFPAAHDDAFASYKWVLKNAGRIGGDAKRVAVMGESAGGNLAINTAIKARDAKIQLPVYEALIYPVAGVNMNTQSYIENTNAKPLNKPMMAWFMKNALRSDADKKDPRLDLVGRAKLQGLPPTTIIAAEIDPLLSEGQALAQRLEQSGVKVNYKHYEGVTHEFFGMGLVIPEAMAAEAVVAKDLRFAFAK